MITEAFIFLATALTLLGFYLWYKRAYVEIIQTKGIGVYLNLYSEYFDGIERNYIDLYLPFFIVSFIYDEEC